MLISVFLLCPLLLLLLLLPQQVSFSSAQVSVCAISLFYRRSFFPPVLRKALYLLFLFFHYRSYSLSYQANSSWYGNVCNHMCGICRLILFCKTCIFYLFQYYEEKFFPLIYSKPIPEIASML